MLGCNKGKQKPDISDKNRVEKKTYFSTEALDEYKKKSVKYGDAQAYGYLVDNYYNSPSDYYELLPISMIMADKYNNDNARSSIYYQMIMINNEGKLNDTLFFKLNRAKQDFVVSYLIDGLKNNNPGCKALLKKITDGGYEFRSENRDVESLLK